MLFLFKAGIRNDLGNDGQKYKNLTFGIRGNGFM
jgi:hypothetical protein